MSINGQVVVSLLDYKHRLNKPVNIGSELSVGGCETDYGSFIGYLTEFNGWDRKVDNLYLIIIIKAKYIQFILQN